MASADGGSQFLGGTAEGVGVGVAFPSLEVFGQQVELAGDAPHRRLFGFLAGGRGKSWRQARPGRLRLGRNVRLRLWVGRR